MKKLILGLMVGSGALVLADRKVDLSFANIPTIKELPKAVKGWGADPKDKEFEGCTPLVPTNIPSNKFGLMEDTHTKNLFGSVYLYKLITKTNDLRILVEFDRGYAYICKNDNYAWNLLTDAIKKAKTTVSLSLL